MSSQICVQTFLVITVQLFQLFWFSLFSFLICFGLALEPNCEGSDRLRAAGCHGNGVFGPEEICAQRSCSTQLHVSHGHVGSSSGGIFLAKIFAAQKCCFVFLGSGWTSRTRSRWQTLAWPEMFWTKSITAFRTTGRRSCPSSGWPSRVYRPKNSPPNQMWWEFWAQPDIKEEDAPQYVRRLKRVPVKTLPSLSDAVVLWCSDMGDADQRSESLPRRGPIWYNTLPPEGQEASAASVLPWPSVRKPL